jgi:hypothetical protein
VANGNFGAVDKGYTCAFAKTNGVQKNITGIKTRRSSCTKRLYDNCPGNFFFK